MHIVTKPLHKKELSFFISNYIHQRKSRSLEFDDLVVLNSSNIKDYQYVNEDRDYYFSFIGCLLCKGFLKSFHALILHMFFCHQDLTFYFSVLFHFFKYFLYFYIKEFLNPFTKILENHLVILTNPADKSNFLFYNPEDKSDFKIKPFYIRKISNNVLYEKINNILNSRNMYFFIFLFKSKKSF